MERICSITGLPFNISEAEQEYCRQNDVPLPGMSPYERLCRMIYFRNRFHLYNAVCGYSKKPMLSSIPPESGMVVYDVEYWESDVWDATEYSTTYDFSRSFFEQFRELLKRVPEPNLAVIRSTMENSDYCNGITGAKNCYLLFGASYNEDCLFCTALWRCRSMVDCSLCYDSELCYDSRNLRNCYHVKFSEHSVSCADSLFLSNCQNCKNCYGCINLANREYCFYNQQLSQDEYQKKLQTIDLGSYETLLREKAKFAEFKKDFPIKFYFGRQNQESIGNYLYNTKNCRQGYFLTDAEDVEYGIYLDRAKNCFFHAMFGNNAELIYNSVTCGDNVYNIRFSRECWMNVHDLEYCWGTCYGANNCFGCVGIKKKSYCILNKQYRKEEYFDMVGRIKRHMLAAGEYGQFFPISFSPFYYNLSDANYFFPLTKDHALVQGFRWEEEKQDVIDGILSQIAIPDHIRDFSGSQINSVFLCEKTGKKYKLVKQELDFYRRENVPIPRIAPMERIKQTASILEVGQLHDSKCALCGQVFETVFGSNQVLYCEECYQKAVY